MNKELLNCERVWLNVTPATLRPDLADYGLLEPHALGVHEGKIHALVPMQDLKGPYPAHWQDMKGKLATPGLIDCHTHLIFAGSRAEEFELRQKGVPYAEIARKGGGILSTVRATRAASEEQLFTLAAARIKSLIREGVTTVEIKSGYGLTLEDELKMLRVARRLGEALPIRVKTTLLAAHAVPPEYRDDPDSWVETICQEIIPAAAEAGLADAVDVFCEHIGFSLAQTEQVYLAADQYGLPVKGHMEQLSNLGGSALAANFGALSVDHLEHLDQEGIQALAHRGVVATLLPTAFYFLKETKLPPVAALRKAHVPMAVSSDINPGTAPIVSLRMAMNMACTLFGLTPVEAMVGVTRNAARALGEQERLGQLRVGMLADFLVWNCAHPAELSYLIGVDQLVSRVVNGEETLHG
ncbi:imidazolonepropionase [Aeromonas salmonicida subsp. salmonicida]|uniref:Imidazolonepropionase n=2 Tax=Aeromonas salmonicida subsp. salmonicida TaxID=29491 RepID=HUTI_AERS4|nr:imidazolonepropionase [Aeromonas salmonicida]A4SSN5.1 RecName: Full=Imidazolonepropionase; AltName: Full=Imidazolone-5-propionate hydrolase [Aeromonas salmonicida subsp. salmonicida A449]ABO91907.1 imidazolonepropionase [Aeromonas salmonicida subsp. salmonicida A449]EHI51978.1 imidazolonepropionase [Aeromonas salmonicida subsp. salmonicida 01-B526]EKP0238929.1 imidazolonepropionase [Aeromonas salmonicida]EKP0243113.1 imidazolonepropionase [Aeromonas salmonicida]EKP0251496.1 imidazoloneprop